MRPSLFAEPARIGVIAIANLEVEFLTAAMRRKQRPGTVGVTLLGLSGRQYVGQSFEQIRPPLGQHAPQQPARIVWEVVCVEAEALR